jgi:2-dehydropantoate 2-reductase
VKICILGAGAIGGYLGTYLWRAGHDVSFLARGPHLEAMRLRGVSLREGERELEARPRCVATPEELGVQDWVVSLVKAPSLVGLLPRIGPLLGPGTPVVISTNGIPWWYGYGAGGDLQDFRFRSLDPDGVLERSVERARILGCVVKAGATVEAPGVIRHFGLNRFFVGEPLGGVSERAARLAEMITGSGLDGIAHPRIHDQIWTKLLENMPLAPIAALTGGTIEEIIADPGARALCERLHAEGVSVGRRFGLAGEFPMAAREDLARRLPGFKSSMLQDFEHRRPMEIDALVTAVLEMAARGAVATPTIAQVHALVMLRARLAGLTGNA